MAMIKRLLAIALCVAAFSTPSSAQDRVTLGWGRLFSNDALGDARDRWRTGSYTVSRIRGSSWSGALPVTPGELLEFRVRAETIAPSGMGGADRRYAGLLSLGLHTQFDWQGNEVSLGADLVVIGPQTGIGSFQSWAHDVMGMAPPEGLENQLPDAVYPTAVVEVGRSVTLGDRTTVRPFVEMRAGAESLVRVGGDIVLGGLGRGDLMLRDPATGLRYRGVEGSRNAGVSLMLGGDVAQVFDSALLPSGGAAVMSDQRTRLRAGMHWQGEKASAFYGVSYLSPEFDQQVEGQIVGALSINLRF